MFDLLKKKLSDFVSNVSKKETAEKVSEEKKVKSEKAGEAKEIKIEKDETRKTALEKEAVEEEIVSEEKAFEKKDSVSEKPLKAKISLETAVKSFLSAEIELTEKDLKDLLDELEFSLLEADVEQNTAEKICFEMKKSFVGKKVKKSELNDFLKNEIEKILENLLNVEKINLLKAVEEKKPFVILFLGPNGVGKTTTIAKITDLLQKNCKSVLLAAGDTFRAASIEQLEKHAQVLGVKVVKHNYGADPAAVAFDAIAAAKSKAIDVVLIDSAGRQETNKNLLSELQKIVRVAKPDLKIYVGESYTGQALLQQAREFDESIGLNGFILTKMDVDSKGGTTLSLIYNLKKPILFIGTGQEYSDLEEFDERKFVRKLLQ